VCRSCLSKAGTFVPVAASVKPVLLYQ
jgi:hypothetical protein